MLDMPSRGNPNHLPVKQEAPTIPKKPETILRELLTKKLELSELQTIALKIGTDIEDLIGDGISGKARELIEYARRRGKSNQLVQAIHELRPDIDLSDFGIQPESTSTVESKQPVVVQLAELLNNKILPHELRLIAVYAGTTLDTIAGQSHSEKATGLVLYFQRRKDLSTLLTAIKKIRPDIDLSSFVGITGKQEQVEVEKPSATEEKFDIRLREMMAEKVLPADFDAILSDAGITPATFHPTLPYPDRISELIKYMVMRRALPRLLSILATVRPDIDLNQLTNESGSYARRSETLLDFVQVLHQNVTSIEQMKKICTYLKVGYDNLPGEILTDKIIGLARYMHSRENRSLAEIHDALKQA